MEPAIDVLSRLLPAGTPVIDPDDDKTIACEYEEHHLDGQVHAVCSLHMLDSSSMDNIALLCAACLVRCVAEWVTIDRWEPFVILPISPPGEIESAPMDEDTTPQTPSTETAPGTDEPTPVAAPNPGVSGLPSDPTEVTGDGSGEALPPIDAPVSPSPNPGINPNPSTEPYVPGPAPTPEESSAPVQHNVTDDIDDPRRDDDE